MPTRAGPSAGHVRPDTGVSDEDRTWDAVVIGSGFGGAMAAHAIVERGLDVLMLERGDWVDRGEHNRDLSRPWRKGPAFSKRTPYHAEGETRQRVGSFHCVGGASVFFGGVALRLRPEDFEGEPAVSGEIRWPFGYQRLRPWYRRAEALLGVTGDTSGDPTAPPRDQPLPPSGLPLSPTSRALRDAAERLGLRPFRLPLTLNSNGSRARCVGCGTCDGFPCYIGAKNDLATATLPDLMARGMALRTGAVVVGFHTDGTRVEAVEVVDRESGKRSRVRADRFVLAAGALGTPHLLLSAGLDRLNPAGGLVGRHLMRHCNAIVAGPTPAPWGEPGDFRKQIGIHDYYLGDDDVPELEGKVGAIQQIRATRVALAELGLPAPLARAVQPLVDRSLALIVLAEDQPRPENRVWVDHGRSDAFGLPRAHIHHRHTERDRAALRVLVGRARELLREFGVPFTVTKSIHTFSHALGTVRMGDDPSLYPVAPDGRFRGLDNLWVSDASVFPTAGAVNPSLTVSANALRIGTAAAAAPGGPTMSREAAPGPPRPAEARA